jgi:hypothetical protein
MTLNNSTNKFTGLSNIYQDNSGNIGVKTATPQADFNLEGSAWFHGNYVYLHYTELQQSLSGNCVSVQKTVGDDNNITYSTIFDVAHNISGGFAYSFNFFKGTATSGNTSVNICKADGLGTINHLFSGNGNSYLAVNNGNVGIGISLPTQKLHVNGVIRATSFLVGTAQQFLGWGSAIPTTGTYKRGDIIFNSAPVASGFVGWTCITAGTPGTWKSFGMISA